MTLRILSKICLAYFIFLLVLSLYVGIITKPTEGDSLGYHIPLAKAFINGTIFTPEKIVSAPFQNYSPASSEAILSLFYFLHIPANTYNVVGCLLLFLALFYLGKNVGFGKDYSVVFATSIATLNGIARWLDSQIIDIYLAAFFAFSLALLLKPEKKIGYFVKLGVVVGMLIGSKYSGLLFAILLGIVFLKRVLKFITFKYFLAFSLCCIAFGFVWYIRNYILMGNPLYPQGFLFFKDAGFEILERQVYKIALSTPFGFFGTLNAAISEYMVWVLSVPFVVWYVIYHFRNRVRIESGVILLSILGTLNYLIYAMLPSDNINHIMVSVIRYSYPAFIPFVLALFIIARKYGYQKKLAIIAIGNMFFVSYPQQYVPKLIFVVIPIVLLFISRGVTSGAHKDRRVKKK